MRVLMIGDVFANSGVSYLRNNLNKIINEHNIDFVIANGENSSPIGKGITKTSAEYMLKCGVDAITLGNHAFNHPDIYELFDNYENIIRPANYPIDTAGEGYCILTAANNEKICIINLNGRIFIDNFDCPFRKADKILKAIPGDVKNIFVDFHAEATSEKLALAYYLDGRVSAVLGTHTHIQTADEKILENKTAYITDVGMTGVTSGIIGVKKEIVIEKMYSMLPRKFEVAEGTVEINAVVVQTDENGKANEIIRIKE